MFTTIQQAVENFCLHQIQQEYKIAEGTTKKSLFIAYIDIDAGNGTKHRVYIASDEAFVQRVTYLFLEEDESDQETLISMILETANLIVGSAKVIAEESHTNSFTIGTPVFKEIGEFSIEVDSVKTFTIDNDNSLTIAIKELYDH